MSHSKKSLLGQSDEFFQGQNPARSQGAQVQSHERLPLKTQPPPPPPTHIDDAYHYGAHDYYAVVNNNHIEVPTYEYFEQNEVFYQFSIFFQF